MKRLAIGISLIAVLGCSSRNIYKNARLKGQPPLEHGFVHVTRENDPDAGQEPVEFGAPLVTKDTVYLASETQGLEAFTREGFRRRWRFPVKNGLSSSLLLDGKTLYFGGNDGAFHAVDADRGVERWHYDTKAPVFARATARGGRVFVSASDDTLYCLDQVTGKWVWHYRRGGSYITTIHGNSTAALQDGVAYVGFSDGYIVALNARDGNLKWEQKIHRGTKFTDVDAMPLLDGDRIYIPSYDGELYALMKRDGKVLWHIDFGSSRKVLLDGKTLYLASSLGSVYSVNKDTGRVGWKFELDSGTPTSLVLHGNYLAFGGSHQYFYAIHKGDGTLAYRFSAGLRSGFMAEIVEADGQIYAFSNFGNLHLFRWTGPRATGRVAAR